MLIMLKSKENLALKPPSHYITKQINVIQNLKSWKVKARDMLKVSLDSRPIKIQPGTYCMVDGAHALQIT